MGFEFLFGASVYHGGLIYLSCSDIERRHQRWGATADRCRLDEGAASRLHDDDVGQGPLQSLNPRPLVYLER